MYGFPQRTGRQLKFSIKTRIWLLGLISVAGILLVLVAQYHVSSEVLAENAEMVDRLAQADRLSRLAHELQRERGLSNAFLAQGGDGIHAELRAQRVATDHRLGSLDAPQRDALAGLASLAGARERVSGADLDATAAFEFYTRMLASILAETTRLAKAPGAHPMRSDLFAHAGLAHAKEYLGQVRAVLAAAPDSGRVDPAWLAAMGQRVGLFESHLDLFLRDANPALKESLLAALREPEMTAARGLVAGIMAGRLPAQGGAARRNAYATMTAGIDLLRETERHSLIELQAAAAQRQAQARRQILLQRGALLLVAAALAYLALSSLMTLMRALEAALAGARRLSRGGGRGAGADEGRDEAGEISQSFTELLDMVDRLSVKASTDALTGALNRHGFAEAVAGELLRAQRYRRNLALMLLDLDHFKAINDRHGHAVGDRVLREAARLVRDNLRGADVFCRWGGEEFVVLTPETSGEDASRLAEKLGRLMREHRAQGLPRFTASFGVAAYAPGDDMEILFAKADHAMYQAKRAGRDRVVVYRADGAAAPGGGTPRSHIALVADRDPR